MFKSKKILITGGTGSFGKTMLHNFLNYEFDEIRVFSRDEKKQEDLRLKLNDPRVKFYIGDVRDFNSVNEACKNINFIFHAAALKQVPSCEFYPNEAFKTNVVGSENLMNAAIQNKVSKVILLSTDKAVYPINAMGISKAMMEKIMISKARTLTEGETTLIATRYGNVMGSRGSVIPLFISQIKNNKPITITDPNMTRFLMSLDESINLVLYAFNKGKQGEIYVQKSPACTIDILAKSLKDLFNSDLPINVIGTRHGEKLYETLV
ncbi:MAG: UDP-glucose 4-epimerase, partial [SAR116 cluster bacterium]